VRKKQTEPFLSAYLHSKGCKLGLPIGGNFELTSRCNFRCPMCYVHQVADAEIAGRELTAQQWISLATQARDMGMVFALLTGGEPFIRQDFFDIYRGFAELGIYLSINSNGSLITKEVRQELLKNPPVRINISLYGASDDTYRKMCGQAAFDQVVENIIALKEAGIDVRLNHSITPYNRQDLQQIYEISKELDLHVKTASYMYPPVRLKDGQFGCGNRLSAEEAARSSVEWDLLRLDEGEFMERAEGIAKLCAVDRSECAVEMDDGIGCRAGRSCFWLTWEGKMLPCGMMPGTGADPLKDGFAAAWQKTMDDTKQIHRPKECLQCPKKDICSVCAAVCVTETGAFDCVPDYVCRQTDAFIEITRQEYEKRKG
jgi:MoaA/NifB/PqqE/SkfB family radical SAM enzyme